MNSDRGISFGGGLKWFHEDRFRSEMGLTVRAFRRFCRQINCPMLRIGQDRLICIATWKICMWAINRPGQRDFLASGCESIRQNRSCEGNTTYPIDYLEANIDAIVRETVAIAAMDGIKLDPISRDATREAVERIIAARALFDSPNAHEHYMRMIHAA